MKRDKLITAVSDAINTALSTGTEPDVVQYRQHDPDLYDQIMAAYESSVRPTEFYHVPIWQVNDRFEQAYELLRITFAPEVLDPRAFYVDWLSSLTEPPDDLVMIGRFWRASGRHTYSPEGTLTQFAFDPLASTESIAGIIIGDFTMLADTHGFGTVGYLAVRPAMRQGRGHGSTLTSAFEDAVAQAAKTQAATLDCIVLEAEDRARQYWARQGYRYPRDSQYVQPSLRFDPATGDPLNAPVSETFMLKFTDNRQTVPRDELIAIARRLYENWYAPELASETANQRANQHVFDTCLQGFIDSVAASGEQVDLIWPPE